MSTSSLVFQGCLLFWQKWYFANQTKCKSLVKVIYTPSTFSKDLYKPMRLSMGKGTRQSLAVSTLPFKPTVLFQHVQTCADPQDKSGKPSDIDCSLVWATFSVDRSSTACLPMLPVYPACPGSTMTWPVWFRWDSAAYHRALLQDYRQSEVALVQVLI